MNVTSIKEMLPWVCKHWSHWGFYGHEDQNSQAVLIQCSGTHSSTTHEKIGQKIFSKNQAAKYCGVTTLLW